MSSETAPTPESGAEDQSAPQERRGWPWFWPWLIITMLLLLLIGAALWHLHTRTPQIVEVMGETPPPEDPDPDLVARAAELRQQITLRQSELDAAIQALDPPRCEPPKIPDQDLLDKVRAAEADNIRRWRSLLVPLEPALPQSRPVDETAPPTNESPPPAQPPDQATAPEADAPVDTAPLKRRTQSPTVEPQPQSSAPSGDTGTRLTTAQLRDLLEKSSVIVIGLAPRSGKGLSTGTGFFISPTTIVTNRHVIEAADPDKIYVTSGAFQRLQPVKLVAQTPGNAVGTLDFAVLNLERGSAPAHVPLSTGREKLSSVIAAGYPGLALKTDAGFKALLDGDLSAAPDLNMNSGEIRSVRELGQILQIVHTADVLQGYSGGPLMDACGRVIGVNTFIQVDRTQAAKMNNAISVSDLVGFLRSKGISAPVDQRPCPGE